jgi:predicted nucleic acid-binding protein
VIDGITDTNIIIDLLRQYSPALQWATEISNQQLGITPIVWMEVAQGSLNRAELEKAVLLMRRFRIEHSTPADNDWAMLQLARFRLSHNVQFPDVMIASVAVRLQVPLYTRNIKHFSPLPDLICEAPYY